MRAYENDVFSHVRKQLSDEAKLILDYQLSMINLVQRSSNDKEVNFYAMAGPKRHMEFDSVFVDQGDERSLATLIFDVGDGRKSKITTTAWLVRGKIFSLTFNKAPLKLLHEKYIITSCNLNIDPMSKNILERGPIPEFTPIIDQLNEIHPVSEVVPLIGEDTLENGKLIESLKLPPDFREFLREASSCRIGQWIILGAGAREVQLDEKELLMIADNPGIENLCVVQNEELPILIICNYSTQEVRQLGLSFIDAIRNLINDK